MGPAEETPAAPERHSRHQIRGLFSRSGALMALVYRDPEHLPERLTVFAVQRLGEPARQWAQTVRAGRPEADPARLVAELRRRTAGVARVDGAIAGTPFFIALVPAYVAYLWQEALMVLRISALYGRDPADLDRAAEMLALRGIHPTVEQARAAVAATVATPLPPKPESRRSPRSWFTSIKLVLRFGGFLGTPSDRSHSRVRDVLGTVAGAAAWVITWVLPLTFMMLMAWSCERDARNLGRRAQLYYDGEAPDPGSAIRLAALRDVGHRKTELLRSLALAASIAVPVGFVAYAEHVRNRTGVGWVSALGALVGLSLVIAVTVIARSR